jgi:LTXXQ motif family protein
LAAHTPANNSAGRTTLFNSTENATRKANPTVRSNAVRRTLNSPAVAGALRNTSALRDPSGRARITATAATAGWHNGRDSGNGWWRHGNGNYGWVGPLYWPFAYYDMYDYAMWGDGYDDSFWGYGYGDIYAGIFAPYGYDDLTGYLPQSASNNSNGSEQTAPAPAAPAAVPDQLAQMCGADSRDIAGLPIDQFQQAIQPTDAQSAALDDLANASVKAAQDLKAACPTNIALTAPDRLAAMQQRIEAMIAAVQTVQPPLEKFYGLLSDEQKARLTALGQDQRQAAATAGTLAQSCGAAQPAVMQWPTAEIDQTVRPTDAQRASLVALQNATTKAADLLKASCLTDDPLTPPARLAAVGKRLDTMLQAIKMVSSALNDFYGPLSDEQKAQFEAIGPQRTSQLETPDVAPTTVRRHRRGMPGPEQIIRRLLSPL